MKHATGNLFIESSRFSNEILENDNVCYFIEGFPLSVVTQNPSGLDIWVYTETECKKVIAAYINDNGTWKEIKSFNVY